LESGASCATLGAARLAERSDRHAVTVEFMIFVISALTCDPLHHLEPELIFAAQP
jgi:hypothetical protein